jgi:hypothetical protein
MNLREAVAWIIQDGVSNQKLWKLNDRSRIWWKIAGKVIERVAEELDVEIDDGYDVWMKSKKGR